MFRRSCITAFVVLIGCAAAQPSPHSIELFVNYTSGGVWPTGASARIYSDGVLTLGDGDKQLRRRVSATDPTFLRIVEEVESPAFHDELSAAAVPTEEWRSSGSWIRIERANTIALIKPPVGQAQMRAVIEHVNLLFTQAFGRRYRPIATH